MMKKLFCLSLLSLFVHIFAQTTFETRISQSSDDAEEKHDGSYVTLTSSDLELVHDQWNKQGNQTIGIRFTDVNIPTKCTITNAYIQFTADGNKSDKTSLVIKGEKKANSLTFVNKKNNISKRAKTNHSISWDNIASWRDRDTGVNQRTPNLKKIIQEIIQETNWKSGNPITFIITGNGLRRAFSYNENPTLSAKLVITYEIPEGDDIELSEIISPSEETIFTNDNIPVTVELKNNSSIALHNVSLQLFLNNQLVSEENLESMPSNQNKEYTFSKKLDLSIAGKYKLKVKAIIANDVNDTNDFKEKNIHVIQKEKSLYFNKNATWRYLDTGTDEGTAWRKLHFDDKKWKLGSGHFGFGEGDEDTKLESGHITYYFRKKVFIEDLSDIQKVFFEIAHDDGAVIYINDKEVSRSLYMPKNINIHYKTKTINHIPSHLENHLFPYPIDISYFKQGENIIAIEVHNSSKSNNDISFECKVTDSYDYAFDGPYVFYEEDKIKVFSTTPQNGVISKTYNKNDEITVTCRFSEKESFTIPLVKNHPIESTLYDMPEKYIAFSDIEGEFEALTFLLKKEGIMDNNYQWSYGNGHIFIPGDSFDRGENVTQCLWLFYKLDNEAKKAGGKVHFILGNHDIMNMIGDFRYVRDKYFNHSNLINKQLSDLYTKNTELGKWLRSKNIIEKAGTTTFVHAGLSPEIANSGLSYEQMNEYARFNIDNKCTNDNCKLVNKTNGPFWYRGMAKKKLSQGKVNEILSKFNTDKIIIGHTLFPSITSLYKGKVIGIDQHHGKNLKKNGSVEVLKYKNGCLYKSKCSKSGVEDTLLFSNCGMNINKTNDSSISIYPNPVKNILHISHKGININHITITDTSGKQVYKDNLSSSIVNVSFLNKGIYILNIYQENQLVKSFKIIKE